MGVWTPEIESKLLALRERFRDLTANDIADIINIENDVALTGDQVSGKLRRLKRIPLDLTVAGLSLMDYPATVVSVSGDAAICACVHVPQTDPEMWERYLQVIDRHALPLAIIAGDIVTGDMFSHWDIKEAYRWEQEIESLRKHLVPLAERVERIVILPGNHIANRIVRISGGHIKLAQVIDMARIPDALRERITTTDLDYLDYSSGPERFYVAHSANYSRDGGKVPVKYAEKYQRHVIAGNGHQIGWQVTPSGEYHGIDLGTMADPKYMGYAQRTLTLFPKMLQSFVTVRDGAVRMYGKGTPLTDWSAEV